MGIRNMTKNPISHGEIRQYPSTFALFFLCLMQFSFFFGQGRDVYPPLFFHPLIFILCQYLVYLLSERSCSFLRCHLSIKYTIHHILEHFIDLRCTFRVGRRAFP